MTKEDLQTQLDKLRQKWIGKVPKSNSDPNYWRFRCDQTQAIGLKVKLNKWKEEIKPAEPDINQVAQMIFG